MSDEDLSKQEKVAHAKRKLKAFQERQKARDRHSSADKENARADLYISTESLAESSVSSPASCFQNNRQYLDPSLNGKTGNDAQHHHNHPPLTEKSSYADRPISASSGASAGFMHDEQRSPFQRISRMSESSDLSRRSSIFQQDQTVTAKLDESPDSAATNHGSVHAASIYGENQQQLYPPQELQTSLASYFVPSGAYGNEATAFSMDQNSINSMPGQYTFLPYGDSTVSVTGTTNHVIPTSGTQQQFYPEAFQQQQQQDYISAPSNGYYQQEDVSADQTLLQQQSSFYQPQTNTELLQSSTPLLEVQQPASLAAYFNAGFSDGLGQQQSELQNYPPFEPVTDTAQPLADDVFYDQPSSYAPPQASAPPFTETGHESIPSREPLPQPQQVDLQVQPVLDSYEGVSSRENDQKFEEVVGQLGLAQQQLHEQQVYCQSVVAEFHKMQELYGQMHAAYTGLVESSQTAEKNAKRKQEELERAVQQHQQMVGVFLAEKTEHQAQLKQALESSNQRNLENEELKGRLKANRERISTLEKELEVTAYSHGERVGLAKRQAVDLELTKRELETLRDRLADFQLESRELSAKLRGKAGELESAQSKISDLEKQLELSHIYLQSAGQSMQASAVEQERLAQASAEAQRLKGETETLKEKYARSLQDTTQQRVRYEAYVQQLTEQLNERGRAIETLTNDRTELEQKLKSSLEEAEQLKTLSKGNEAVEKMQLELSQAARSHADQMISLRQGYESDIRFLRSTLDQREAELNQKSVRLVELSAKIEGLEAEVKESSERHTDASTILQSLQNEKATASRAVAQNQELKSQLTELQDKFVKLTEDTMESTTRMQSMQHTIAQLTNEVEGKNARFASERAKLESEIHRWKDENTLLMRQEFERAQLIDRLRHFEVSYQTTSEELKAAKELIMQLHERVSAQPEVVESSDSAKFTDRINQLTAENDALKQMIEDQRLREAAFEIERATLTRSAAERTSTARDQETQLKLDELTKRLENAELVNRGLRDNSDDLRIQLHRLQGRFDHVSRENDELHRIMEQNSEDENQNSIKVELQNALDRINALSNENRELSRINEQQQQQFQLWIAQQQHQQQQQAQTDSNRDSAVLNGYGQHDDGENTPQLLFGHSASASNAGDDRSSVCSEHNAANNGEPRRDATPAGANPEAFENLRKAMEMLQDRFTRAMNDNANLSEHNHHLEHLIEQLQAETDSVGEYITLYQHQRSKIRERMREKDEYIAKLARDNEQIRSKLTLVQELVMKLLGERGALHPYRQLDPPARGRTPRHSKSPPAISRHKAPRRLSETVVDETTGEIKEVNILDNSSIISSETNSIAGDLQVALRDFSQDEDQSFLSRSADDLSNAIEAGRSGALDATIPSSSAPSLGALADASNGPIAERILSILSEIQGIQPGVKPPPHCLHCKYCRGRLQDL